MKFSPYGSVFIFLFFLFFSNASVLSQHIELSIITDVNMGVVATHGLDQLEKTLQAKRISFEVVNSGKKAAGSILLFAGKFYGKGETALLIKEGRHEVAGVSEALTIWHTHWQLKPVTVVSGYDDKGLMYALLDVAMRVSWIKERTDPLHFVREVSSKPYTGERGIAMYTMNRTYWESRFYDKNFWIRYLDMMAQDRLNMLEILFGYENGGFLAPCYPYFFQVEGYPNVTMSDITPKQQARNVAAMNRIIQMAHERGIGIRLGIWDHIYRGGVQAGGNPAFNYDKDHPHPWEVTGLDSANLNEYTKAAFTKFLKTFPSLDAILFKTNDESGVKASELNTFSMNFFKTVKEVAPDMMVDIHAKGLTDTLIQSAIRMGLKFRIAPKFWMEQLGLPFSPTHINREDQQNRRQGYADLLRYPQKYQMLWKLWNGGSNRVFLWGDPQYVRRFAAASHMYNSDAFEVYEPLATKMEAQDHYAKPFQLLKAPYRFYRYEFERYWYFFQTFGLVGYDPKTPDDVWNMEFNSRFGESAGPLIQSALNESGWILPRVVAACYPYSFFPTTSAWPEKQRLGDLPLYASAEGSDLQQFASFDEEAQVLLGTLETAKTLPSTTSAWLAGLSTDIRQKVTKAEKLMKTKDNKEFNSTVVDLNMLAYLALYHSRRIPAAVNYRLYLYTRNPSVLDSAIAHEESAIKAWQQLVHAAGNMYADNILIGNKSLSGHWRDELVLLNRGVEKLKEQRANFKPKGEVRQAVYYKADSSSDHAAYFRVHHHAIDTVAAGKSITIKLQISAPAGIKWVRLRYRAMNQYKDFETLPMHCDHDGARFLATIPAENIDPHFDLMYLVEMMDNDGNGFIYPDFNKATPYKIIHLTTR